MLYILNLSSNNHLQWISPFKSEILHHYIVLSSFLETGYGKPQVGDRADQGVVDPQLLS